MTQGDLLNFWWKNTTVKTSKYALTTGGTEQFVQQSVNRIYLSWRSDPGLIRADFTPLSAPGNQPIHYDNNHATEVDFNFQIDRNYSLVQVGWTINPFGTLLTMYITEVFFIGV